MRRRSVKILVAAGLAPAVLACAPGAASASTLSFSAGRLVYTASGTSQALTVASSTSSQVTFSGLAPGQITSQPAACGAQQADGTLTCTLSGLLAVELDLSPGDDIVGAAGVASVPVVVNGFGGNDTISGGSLGGSLNGGDGDDVVTGAGGDDTIDGGAGDDKLSGGPGGDVVKGGDGADSVAGEGGNDLLDGGAQDDSVSGGDGLDRVGGGSGDDLLRGDAGDDMLDGGGGRDALISGSGGDDLHGGDGFDLARFDDRRAAVTVSIDGRADDGEAGEGDNVEADVEDAVGGSGDDALTGSDASNVLDGGPGRDRVTGGAGADQLLGSAGDDAIFARDDVNDGVDCGDGTDAVQADGGDQLVGCEAVDRPLASVFHTAPAPNDIDRDGSPRPLDCDDLNASVHPGAAEVPGNAVDEDCNGVADGSPHLRSTVSSRFVVTHRRSRVARLRVARVPAGATVAVRCAGGGCPRKARSYVKRYATAAATVRLESLFAHARLRPKAKVTVSVTRPLAVGVVVQLVAASRAQPARSELCLNPGGKKAGPC